MPQIQPEISNLDEICAKKDYSIAKSEEQKRRQR